MRTEERAIEGKWVKSGGMKKETKKKKNKLMRKYKTEKKNKHHNIHTEQQQK